MRSDDQPVDRKVFRRVPHSASIVSRFTRGRAAAPKSPHMLAVGKWLSAAVLIAVAAGCNDLKAGRGSASVSQAGDSGWTRLPSSREATCTDSSWVCAKWKDQEWERRSLYLNGTVAFVTLRAVDRSFTTRLQVSCPGATYRIVWDSSLTFDTLTTPAWIPMTDRWERSLWADVCEREAGIKGA